MLEPLLTKLRRFWIIFFIAGLGLAFLLGLGVGHSTVSTTTGRGKITRLTPKGYPLIGPILACEIGDESEFTEFRPIQTSIASVVKQKIQSGAAENISVYFRVMNSGRWIGVDEDRQYSGASLLKLPQMIAYYKLTESTPNILEQKIKYTGDVDLSEEQTIPPAQVISAGHEYTVQDLIRRAIVYSDNNANYLLLKNINLPSLLAMYQDLQLPSPAGGPAGDAISPKSYGLLFRVLYGSTYLSPALSNQALDLLTKTDFKLGLVAGVPSGTTVAHKFGERVDVDDQGNTTSRELHDCGIIYFQNSHPYFLCVMTRGKDFNRLAQAIADISHETYQQVDTYWKSHQQ